MSRRSVWIALALYLLATALLYGSAFRAGMHESVPTLPSAPRARPIVRADPQWAVWAVARNARTLATRPHRLFDAEQCFPDEHSLSLGEPVIALGLLGLPAWLLTREPVVIYNVALALHTLAAALAMYCLVAAWTGRASAGISAGLLYAFSGIAVREVVHPYAADTTGIVLALFFAERLFARGRWRDAVGLTAATAFQLATSFYPIVAAFLVALPFGTFLLVRYRPWKPSLAQMAAVVIAVAASATILLGPYVAQHDAGVFSRDLTLYFLPWSGHLPGRPAFFGWLGLTLASLGILLPGRWSLDGPRPGLRWALVVAALLAAGMAAGPHGAIDLYSPLAAWLPGFDSVRLPHKISSGVHLVLSILAGLGFAGLLRVVEQSRQALGLPIAVAGVAACAASVAMTLPDYRAQPVRPKQEHVDFHRELSATGNAGAIYETPIPGFGGRFTWPGTAAYLVLAEFHRRPTSACYPSHPQPHRAELEQIERALPSPEAVGDLGRLGFTTIVVHHSQAGAGSKLRRNLFARAARRPGSLLRKVQTSPGLTAYAIERGEPR
ncbi:MAG: hypothetical protein VX466_11135 [Myxococcota bacterium]|nr:hypothetical protein [Myxococcota bacterium]